MRRIEEKDFGAFSEVCRISNCMIKLSNGKAIFGYDVRFCKHFDEQHHEWNALIIVQRTSYCGHHSTRTKILKAYVCDNEEGNAIFRRIEATKFRAKSGYFMHNITHIL